MRYTLTPTDTFEKLQLNAGILCRGFDPSAGTYTKILGATSGGTTVAMTPTFKDLGDGIDNVPANTYQFKQVDYWVATASGTFKSLDKELTKELIAAADISENKITPRHNLSEDDFDDLWIVADYSDKNGENKGGYVAVCLKHALSTGGFSWKTNDKGKGDFAFTYTGHYDLNNLDEVPFEVYIVDGEDEE